MQYNVGDYVRCMWGAKPVEYEAKIIHVNSASKEYFVHYQGWNKRYDEWISGKSILGMSKKSSAVVCDTPKVRHSKREKKTRRPVDWSPTPTSSRVTERPVSGKIDCKGSTRISKPKRSPVFKVVKQSRPPVPTVVDDSAEESITSDEEDGGAKFPRSYIDTLAKLRKREERKRKRQSSPKPQSEDPIGNSCKSSVPTDIASEIPSVTSTGYQPTTDIGTAGTLSGAVSSSLVECHSFSDIEADYNYSSLRFHYNDAQDIDSTRKNSNTARVTSSTKRMSILPLRKPLNVHYNLPHSAPFNLYTKASSVNLGNRQTSETPPYLGSPFSYDDECNSSLRTPIKCKDEVDVANLLNQHASDSSATSSSSSESGDSSSDQTVLTREAVSVFTIAT